eukprot:16434928-Heterocapsa_arctica.AAC.1
MQLRIQAEVIANEVATGAAPAVVAVAGAVGPAMLLYRVLGQDGLGAGGPVPAILPLVGGGIAQLPPAVAAAPAAPVAAEGVNAL